MHQSNISQQGRAHFYLHCFYDLKVYEESCTYLWIDAAKLNVEEKQFHFTPSSGFLSESSTPMFWIFLLKGQTFRYGY